MALVTAGYDLGPGGYFKQSDGSGPYAIDAAGVATLIGASSGGGAVTNAGTFAVQNTAALPAGTNEIGKVNEKHFNVLGATLTRAANTTPYSINDAVSDNATPGSVTALTTNDLSDANDIPVDILEILLISSDTGPGTANATIRCHLFNTDPTASSGVVGGDNLAYSNKQAGWIGSFSGVMRPFSDGSRGRLVPDEGTILSALPASGAKNYWYQLQTLTAFTPSANSTTFAARFKGFQARL